MQKHRWCKTCVSKSLWCCTFSRWINLRQPNRPYKCDTLFLLFCLFKKKEKSENVSSHVWLLSNSCRITQDFKGKDLKWILCRAIKMIFQEQLWLCHNYFLITLKMISKTDESLAKFIWMFIQMIRIDSIFMKKLDPTTTELAHCSVFQQKWFHFLSLYDPEWVP